MVFTKLYSIVMCDIVFVSLDMFVVLVLVVGFVYTIVVIVYCVVGCCCGLYRFVSYVW